MSNGASRWQSFLDYSQRIVQKNAAFITAFMIMNVTTQGWVFYRDYDYVSLLSYIFSMFLTTFVLVHCVELLRNTFIRRTIKTLIIAICGIVFGVEFFTMYNYNALVGAGILNSIIETNSHEAVEFVISHAGIYEAIMLAAAVAMLLLLGRKLLEFSRKPSCISGRKLRYALILGIIGSLELGIVHFGVVEDDYFPLQRISSAAEVTVKNIKAYKELANQLNDNIVLTRNDSKVKNVVFVIGESCNRNHMGLYGYYLPNTPNLSKMAAEKKIFTFKDTISPHSTTIAVLSKLLTFCDYESPEDWYKYNNIIDVMNKAGYKTFWLSNQESSGVWGNVAQIFAQHSSQHEFTRIRDSKEDYGILDEELFPLIDRARAERSDKNFFVIHLMGQHDLYYNRYPYSFHKFKEQDIKLDLNDKGKLTVAQYDNSVLYNDYIMSQIMDKFKDDETLLVYISDHGEAVYDGTNFNGHVEENPNRHMIEVPFIMWASDKYRAKYPEKIEQISRAVNRPYMSDDMVHTVLDLMDINTPDYQPQKSIVNDLFDSSRKRIYNGTDYDKEIKTGLVTE